MSQVSNRLATTDKALIIQAGDVLARAFSDDPAWVWTCPDPEARRRTVWLVEQRILRMHVPLGHCWVTTESTAKQVLAAAAWRPPGRDMGTLTYLRYGLLRVPFVVGLRTFRRLLHIDTTMKTIRRKYAPAPECWFLDTIGVSPEAQGRGLGSESLCTVLRDVVEPSGLPATLFTSNPVNLPFYEHAGFEVLREERVGGGDGDGFIFWYMTRQ